LIDRLITVAQLRDKVSLAVLADDAEFVRRLYLDLVGRIPTSEEARLFLQDPAGSKRARLIDTLLASDEFAKHWRENLHTYLMGAPPFAGDPEWRTWLENALKQNQGWDVMVRTILRARPTRPEENGAGHFLVSRFAQGQTGLDAATRDISRFFFGVDIQCARCHKHPEVDQWKQEAYWGMAAFWNRSYSLPVKGKFFLAERATGEVEFTTKARVTKTAEPRFLTGEKLVEVKMAAADTKPPAGAKPGAPPPENPSDYVVAPETANEKTRVPLPKYSRRDKVVELAINAANPYFKRAAVNYVWAQLFGRGLVEPIDQMHDGNPASHPELLQLVADDFAGHGFDLRYLIRGIANSQAYQRTSRWSDPKTRPAEASYACAAIRPLSAHQLALSLLIATGCADSIKPSIGVAIRTKLETQYAALLNELVGQLGNRTETFQPSIRESLFQANSESFARFLTQGGLATRLATLPADGQVADEAFWSVLSRPPSAEERARLQQYLQARPQRRPAACQQIVWALVTSAEFRFNH
jgi:hypothetical protein